MKNSILLIFLITNLFASKTYLQIAKNKNQQKLLLHILVLPKNLLRKITIIKSKNYIAIANHLPRYTDFSIWIKNYKDYGFNPKIIKLHHFKKVVDFANPPAIYLESKNNQISVDIEAKGNFQPVIPNKLDIKKGTKKNREAKVTLFIKKKPAKPLFLCEYNFWDSRFNNIPIFNKESFVYQNIVDDNLTYSLVDYNLSKNDKNPLVLSLVTYFKKNNVNYLNTLKNTDPFLGLYVVGDIARNKNSNDYLVKLKWEFFNDGWYEANKILNNKINEREINYKQLLVDMFSYNYNEQIYLINKTIISIRQKYFNEMVQKYEQLLQKKERLLRDGFSVMDDTDHIRERLETMRLNKKFFDAQKGIKPDKKLYELLNSIECLKLVDKKTLENYAIKHNIEVGLQDNYIKRSEYFPEYLDNFRLNVYVAKKNHSSSIGIHTEIPLEFDSERKELTKLQKQNYAMKKKALIQRLKEKIDYLYYEFYYQQNNLKILKNRLKHKYKYLYNIKSLMKNRVTTYEGDSPTNIKDLKEIEIISLNYKIILKRIEIYKILLNLYYVVGSDNINKIIIPKIR